MYIMFIMYKVHVSIKVNVRNKDVMKPILRVHVVICKNATFIIESHKKPLSLSRRYHRKYDILFT